MDWTDILIHGLIAFGLIGFFGPAIRVSFPLVIINTIFWPTRELYQHYPDIIEIFSHPQSLLEWTVPLIVGWTSYKILGDK